jgi:circadian clock protein KaiC
MRLKTGVSGLDVITNGGFEQRSIVLITGGPGTGKTLLALSYLAAGAESGEKGLLVSFEEREDELILDAASVGIDLGALIKQKKVIIHYLEPFTATHITDHIHRIIQKQKIKRVVIDSTSVFGLYLQDVYKIRKRLHALTQSLKELDVTTLMTAEVSRASAIDSSESTTSYSRFGVEEYVADVVILLHYSGLGGGFDRTVQILKMRRTNHKRGLFPMRITSKGIIINSKDNV